MISVRRAIRRSFHSVVIRNQYNHLEVFQEFTNARKYAKKGDYISSVSEMERVHDIVAQTVGNASPMYHAALMELSYVRSRAGLYVEAVEHLMKVHPENLYCRLSEAAIHARHGNIEEAIAVAEQATELCEQQEQADMDLSAFPVCYGSLGMYRALSGDADGAEGALQMAARWSSDAPNVLISMGNLGAIQWHVAHLEEEGSEKRNALIKEAEAYWSEGIDHASELITSGQLSDEGGAAALCGIAGDTQGDSMLGPGMQATRVTPTSTDAHSDEQPMGDLGVALRADKHLAESYANVLCNLALIQESRGKGEQATDTLSSALKAVEVHDGPVLGRVLAAMGRSYAANLQAVQAEGLFRTALDKLSSPEADHDPRYASERAAVHRAYSALLSKWDRREGESGDQEALARALETTPTEAEAAPFDATWQFY